ncbi:MAG: hypothetical protein OK455_02255 [Thaumarchaeota archaeon]|nr:hypothetical protein [Nitrososphaerota archaeon]
MPVEWAARDMICDKCHAGQMVEYQRKLTAGAKRAVLTGMKCERCGFTSLDSDDDVWSVVGL